MEKDEDIIEVIADEEAADTFEEETDGNYSEDHDSISPSLFSRVREAFSVKAALICLAILALAMSASYIAGQNVPKKDADIEKGLSLLREKNSVYIDAKNANDEASRDHVELTEELEKKEKEKKELAFSKDNMNKIAEAVDSLQHEKKELQGEITKKQASLEALESSVSSYTNRIMTWTSGDYTVGRDIAEGDYTITGTGSIAVARSGKSIANELLKSGGADFTFQNEDRIHIDGSAKITPK